MTERFKKGAEVGELLAKMPREGAENALQKTYAEYFKGQAKGMLNQQKQIMSTQYGKEVNGQWVPLSPAENTAYQNQLLRNLTVPSGMQYGGQGTGGYYNPSVPVNMYGAKSFNVPGASNTYMTREEYEANLKAKQAAPAPAPAKTSGGKDGGQNKGGDGGDNDSDIDKAIQKETSYTGGANDQNVVDVRPAVFANPTYNSDVSGQNYAQYPPAPINDTALG
jgi:hypothetical protein